MSHTPGPWTTTNYHNQGIRIGSEHHQITWVDYDCVIPYKANAQLMAAAPDLLEACKVALNELDCHCDEYATPSKEYLEALDKLQSAIAEAEGAE